MHTHAHTHTHTNTNRKTYTPTYTYQHTHINIHTLKHTYQHTHINTHTHISISLEKPMQLLLAYLFENDCQSCHDRLSQALSCNKLIFAAFTFAHA